MPSSTFKTINHLSSDPSEPVLSKTEFEQKVEQELGNDRFIGQRSLAFSLKDVIESTSSAPYKRTKELLKGKEDYYDLALEMHQDRDLGDRDNFESTKNDPSILNNCMRLKNFSGSGDGYQLYISTDDPRVSQNTKANIYHSWFRQVWDHCFSLYSGFPSRMLCEHSQGSLIFSGHNRFSAEF